MQVHKAVFSAWVILALTFVTPGGARAQGEGTSLGPITLSVARHAGAEAIDVSGTAPARRPLAITLVSTLDKDLPDVVLSHTVVVPDANGAFTTTLSIAPGFTRGSVITVLASPWTGGPAVRFSYKVDWPVFSTRLDKSPI